MADIVLDAPLNISLEDLTVGIQNTEDAAYVLVDLGKSKSAGIPKNLAFFNKRTEPIEDIQVVPTPQGLFIPAGGDTFSVDQSVSDAFVQQMADAGVKVVFYCPVVSIETTDTALAVVRHVGSTLSSGVDALRPAAGATQVGGRSPISANVDKADKRPPFPPNNGVSSRTTGLTGDVIKYSDGTVVTAGSETLNAVVENSQKGPLLASILKVKKGNVTTIQQKNYSYNGRELPLCQLEESSQGFGSATLVVPAKATRFGKFDPTDGGVGSPALKLVQTCSSVFGAAVKKSRLIDTFGADFAKSPKLLSAMIEIFHPVTGRFARVPIVDVGPQESEIAELDLTAALDDFLGTQGLGKVQFRVVAT